MTKYEKRKITQKRLILFKYSTCRNVQYYVKLESPYFFSNVMMKSLTSSEANSNKVNMSNVWCGANLHFFSLNSLTSGVQFYQEISCRFY